MKAGGPNTAEERRREVLEPRASVGALTYVVSTTWGDKGTDGGIGGTGKTTWG